MLKKSKEMLAIILTLIGSMLLGCVWGKVEKPYLEDRTEAWEPKLMLNVNLPIGKLDAESNELWDDIIDFKSYQTEIKLTMDSFHEAAKAAMECNFGSAYQEIKADYKIQYDDVTHAMGFINDTAAVVFDVPTGRLKFCANLKNEPNLKLNKDQLQLKVDVASLNIQALMKLNRLAGFTRLAVEPDTDNAALPLTAEGAFDLSVGMDVGSWSGTTPLAATGGAFRVYYCKTSNTMLVVTNTYIQAFDVESGKLVAMLSVKDGFKDQSKRS